MATTAPARVKKLINGVEDIVPESLAGLQAAHPDLVTIDSRQNVVLRAGGPRRGKVGLISGGGSGHEPLHGGFVGVGMLDAAAAGNVFTSPVPDQMEAATRAVDGGAGVLHIVKNYTGDVLNFQLAAELVAGDVEVATVVTNDDVAVQDSLYTAGRRGVGVTVLLEKIAGAHAEAGGSLSEVAATATKANQQGRSMGLALSSCVVPAAGTPTFDLPDDEVEVGIGIHGEPGRRREKLAPGDDMAGRLYTKTSPPDPG
jgi:dihydroxyacetone kinase-like protein